MCKLMLVQKGIESTERRIIFRYNLKLLEEVQKYPPPPESEG